MYYAHVKRLHSVNWRSLYGDTASMQELLLKRVQVLHGAKKSGMKLSYYCQYFTLHSINLFLGERMIILHAGTMKDSYPKLTLCSGLLALVAITIGK